MASSLAVLGLAYALAATGGLFHDHAGPDYPPPVVNPQPPIHRPVSGWVLPPGPGTGWGFPNGNPDGYGWYDNGIYLPLGADRTPEYYFPRYFTVPPEQLLLPSYYNPYLTRGQRYIPYAGCGGAHPMGGPPLGSSELPVYPYNESLGSGPTVVVPRFTGNVAAPPINAGSTGLAP